MVARKYAAQIHSSVTVSQATSEASRPNVLLAPGRVLVLVDVISEKGPRPSSASRYFKLTLRAELNRRYHRDRRYPRSGRSLAPKQERRR